jgi:hypothetical protein
MTDAEVPLVGGGVALVDQGDFHLVAHHRWYGHPQGYVTARQRGTGKTIYMHRLILHPGPGQVVDHIDRDGRNNTRRNLRLCSQSQNIANSPARTGTSSRYKGVYQRENGRWVARIRNHGGKRIHLGTFLTEDEAGEAYRRVAEELYGDFITPDSLEASCLA